MNRQETESVRRVADGKCVRIAIPGQYRVFKDEQGRTVFERFPKKEKANA